MKGQTRILAILVAVSVVTGCRPREPSATLPPTHTSQATGTVALGPTPACLPAHAGGTVDPAVALCAMTLVTGGDLEQVVRDGDTLRAAPGDAVRIVEIAVCAGPFSGNGGEFCVDFVPIDRSGREIASERRGTHTQRVTAGCTSIAGPEGTWVVGEEWRSVSAVVNHWPPDRTADAACGEGRCERDDRATVDLE